MIDQTVTVLILGKTQNSQYQALGEKSIHPITKEFRNLGKKLKKFTH